MNPQSKRLAKAAILVASLDRQAADALLAQMPHELAANIRRAVVQLESIDPAHQDEVINEFLNSSPAESARRQVGIELDGSLAPLAQGATKPVPSTHPLGDGAGTLRPPELRPPFDFLKETGDMKLSQMLMREHPQTIAVVMAHVPPNRAAGILPSFPPEMRKEVLRRMVESERADPLLVREIEQAVRSMLDASNRAEATSPEGLQAVTRILRSAGGSTYRTILDALSFPQRDNEPTEENEPTERIETGADTGAIQTVPKRTFDDVSRLSDAQLAAVLQAADEQTVALALMGASPSLIDRALSVLSHSRAAQQRQAMCPFRPTQLRDIEAAQQSLADLAAQLDSDSDSDADRSKRDVPHRFAATV